MPVLGKRAQRIIGGVTGTALVGAWVLVALNNEGVATAQVELNDGGIWVTNSESHEVGHLNYPALTLDASLATESDSFDITQRADSVFLHDQTGTSIASIDAATVTLGPAHKLDSATVFHQGGNTVAAYDPAEGKLWVTTSGNYGALVTDDNLVRDDLPDGAMTVGPDGKVHAVSAKTGVWIAGDEEFTVPEDVSKDAVLQIAAVGASSVILDGAGNGAYVGGGARLGVSGQNPVLQQSGPRADNVLVATDDSLLALPLGGGEVDVVKNESKGVPAQPVRHNGCDYAVWSGTGHFLRNCPGEDDDVAMDHPKLAEAAKAVFRTNRDVIVLNDIANGNVWLPDENLQLIDNWEEISTESQDTKKKSEEKGNTLSDEPEEATQDKENRAPTAGNDSFGVRAGQVNQLLVSENDNDEDGDILTYSVLKAPSFGTVTAIRNGTMLQIDVPLGTTGSTSFTYEVHDGRGGKATATVTITVHGDEINGAPEQVVKTKIKLADRGSVTLEALGDWVDPDGDLVYLVSAKPIAGVDVRYRQNGTVELTAINATPGLKEIPVTVSDGKASADGVIVVEIVNMGPKPPQANNDHIQIRVGETATVSPIENDSDPNGDALRLVSIGKPPAGLTARANLSQYTIAVAADKEGSFYLPYTVSDGTATSTGRIRVDAVAAEKDAPPVAESDIAMLPYGGSTLVDVIRNDKDFQGGVLTVQSVQLKPGSKLTAVPIRHQLVRITAGAGFSGRETVTYTITNGKTTAQGTILVIGTEPPAGNEPPELKDDRMVVRAGDVGTVEVLRNDTSRSGQTLTVQPTLDYSFDESWGTPFVSDNKVRFRAGTKAGEVKLVYTVIDTLGNPASAQVTVTILPVDEETNTAPTPKDVTTRVLAGRSTIISVPLNGIDPEGDSVELVGPVSSPSLGTVEMTDNGDLVYTAGPTAAGTDVFKYQVRDAFGKVGEARVRIGIAPAATHNQNPVVENEIITIRPGANVEAPVLTNDVDPDGDDIALTPDSLVSSSPELNAQIDGRKIVLTGPAVEGAYTVTYVVNDGRGGSASGLLTVNVSATSPLLAPIAVDDVAVLEEDATNVTVNVIENDSDPDGTVGALTVTSSDPNVTVNDDRSLTIGTTDQRQIVLYTITDANGLTSSAVVRVPAVKPVVLPVVNPGVLIEADAGKPETISINDYITPAVTISDPGKVQAALGWNGANLVKDDKTLVFTSDEDFAGRTSITFEVTDADGNLVTVTLPIEVTGRANRPPSFVPTAIEVGAGEPAIISNLTAMTSDPDPDTQFSFSILSEPGGINASINGDRLEISAPENATLGAIGNITVEVSDGEATVQGTIPVTVVGSSKPLVQVAPITRSVNMGETLEIDVAAAATNPFDSPLTLMGDPGVQGKATVSAKGTVLKITPTEIGETKVNFTLMDATEQRDRAVTGAITLTVRDKPGAPTGVTAAANTVNSAIVSWINGPSNGAPFTDFIVKDLTQGDEINCGVKTQCVLTGRKLGMEHSFQVIAVNEVGQSSPSETASVMLDIVPGQPAPPKATEKDSEVTFNWAAPSNDGSAILNYVLVVNGQAIETTGTSYTMAAVNGNAYSATVAAVNREGASSASGTSNSVVPFGKPSVPTSVTAESVAFGSEGTVRVSWAAPGNVNGAAMNSYKVNGPGGLSAVVDASVTSHTFTGIPFSDSPVQFSVVGYNTDPNGANAVRGTSDPAVAETLVRGAPGTPTGSVSVTGVYGEAVLGTLSGGAANGWRATSLSYEYSVNGGQWTAAASGQKLEWLENGVPNQISLRAVGNAANYAAVPGASVDIGTVTPYGPPTPPTPTCVADGENAIVCSWTGGDGGGLNTKYFIDSNGVETEIQATGEMRFDGLAAGETRDYCMFARQDAPGIESGKKCASATTALPPPPPPPKNPTYQFTLSSETSTCNYGSCQGMILPKVQVTLKEYGANEVVRCQTTKGQFWGDFQTDANGNLGPVDLVLNGYAPDGGPAPATAEKVEYTSIWLCTAGTRIG